jgi:hypothetical protein
MKKLALLLLVPALSLIFVSIPVASASASYATVRVHASCVDYGGLPTYASVRYGGVITVAQCGSNEDNSGFHQQTIYVTEKCMATPYYAEIKVGDGLQIYRGTFNPCLGSHEVKVYGSAGYAFGLWSLEVET